MLLQLYRFFSAAAPLVLLFIYHPVCTGKRCVYDSAEMPHRSSSSKKNTPLPGSKYDVSPLPTTQNGKFACRHDGLGCRDDLVFPPKKWFEIPFSPLHTLSHIRYRSFSHNIIYVCGKTCVEAAKIFLLEKRRQHHQPPSFLPARPNRFLGSSNPSKKMFLGRFLNL